MGMEVKGLDELQKKLSEMGRKSARIENQALIKAAEPILEDAIKLAPERTGEGKKALIMGRPRKKGDSREIVIGISRGDISKIYYMKFHEYGTSKMRARPFMGPAYEKNKVKAFNILKSELKKGVGL